MNAQERFEQYVDEIEDMAEKNECLKPYNIADEITTSHGIGIRDLTAVFSFLTESSLTSYIRERQMMAAYKAIISAEKFDVEIGISITGYSDQSSFGKSFKERFGLTPKEAFEKKDLSKYIEKLTWDALAKDAVLFERADIEVKPVKMRFGISEEQYRIANYAADLQVLFDLDDYQSEKAFELAGIINVEMKLAFEFISEYCFCFTSDKELSLSESSFLMDAAHIYFNVVPNIYTAWDLIDVIKSFGYNISDFSYAFLIMYVKYSNLPIRQIVDWAENHKCGICKFEDIDEEIQEHIDDIVKDNISYEEAQGIFCPDFDGFLDNVMSDMEQGFDDDYVGIEDEERDEWNNCPDEFSRRMSEALENDSYYDDYDTDGQYFDF